MPHHHFTVSATDTTITHAQELVKGFGQIGIKKKETIITVLLLLCYSSFLPSKFRIDASSVVHHITACGIEFGEIFKDEACRRRFFQIGLPLLLKQPVRVDLHGRLFQATCC
jgi:hypothetical protein